MHRSRLKRIPFYARSIFGSMMIVALCTGSASAENLGEQATNPVADLVQFRMQNQFTASSYNADSYGNAALIQTVMPMSLPFEWAPSMVVRPTIPVYVWTPELADPIGRREGMGDTVINAFAIPTWQPKNAVFGIGPTVTLPTAGDNQFTGAGSWQAGPSVVYMYTGKPSWQIGALVFHQWDVGSNRANAGDVSTTFIQPIITKHFDKGWYLAAPDTPQSYNHETSNWSLNLGIVLGRVFKPKNAKRPVQIFGGVYYNSEENDGVVAPEWTIKLNYGILFVGE